MNFLEILVKKGLINRYQIDQIIETSTKEEKSIEKVLVDMGIGDTAILDAKSVYYDANKKEINYAEVNPDIVRLIPEESAKTYQMVAFNKTDDDVLEVGMLDPRSTEAQNVLQFITSETGTPYKIYILTEYGFETIFAKYGGLSNQLGDVLEEFGEVHAPKKEKTEEEKKQEELIKEDSPITKMVAAIIKQAVQTGVSDIHIDHLGEIINVRFRTDGELKTYLEVPKAAHSAMIARIKIMTKTMKLDERRKPQDGRFQAIIDGRKIAFRVSIMPTFYGEKAVLRILDSAKGIRKLAKLGLTEEQEEMIRYAIERPHGLILITGPTGSGKTTSLYSMLGEVDRIKKNVVSLEDPIEYEFPGVNQSQVRADIGYTFAAGLRSIVRQDPDVIMVGEIRDKETANLAIQAALTGHLVFATLHTNSSFGIIPRLVEMGVDPYLIAPTLILGIAQRLLRRIADGAAVPVENEASVRKMLEDQFADYPEDKKPDLHLERQLYEVKGTKENPSGLKGRVAILEMFKVDREIEQIILKDPTEKAIYDAARRKGMLTLKDSAVLKGMEGLVPFSEINTL